MPIVKYGVTGRTVSTQPDAPVICRVYKGTPKSGNKAGANLSHFRFKWVVSGSITEAEAERLEGLFTAHYGAEVARLSNVQFLSDRPEDVFREEMAEWRADTRIRTCDGVTQTFHREGKEVSRERIPCMAGCECKATGMLFFILPEFFALSGVLGKFMLITHAKGDLDSIRGAISLVHEGIERLRGVSFVLSRAERVETTPAGMRVKQWGVSLAPDNMIAQRLGLNALSRALELGSGGPAGLALEAGPEPLSLYSVDLVPAVFITGKRGESPVYRFKDADNVYYECFSPELVEAAIPGIKELALEQAHKLSMTGLQAEFSIEHDGAAEYRVIEALRAV